MGSIYQQTFIDTYSKVALAIGEIAVPILTSSINIAALILGFTIMGGINWPWGLFISLVSFLLGSFYWV